MRVAFGECLFDSEPRELRRDGQPTRISPKAFQFLEALLVHGFGYAFCGAVADLGGAPSREGAPDLVYRLAWGAREIELGPGTNALGRAPGCAVWIDAPGVSRQMDEEP